jgi:hypothetical protein
MLYIIQFLSSSLHCSCKTIFYLHFHEQNFANTTSLFTFHTENIRFRCHLFKVFISVSYFSDTFTPNMATDTILQANFQPTVRDCNITLPAQRTFTNIHTLADNCETFNNENHFLVAQLLHVKACQNENSFALNATSSAARFRGGNSIYQSSKKAKTSAQYRRMFFFMDLLTKGACFVIFEQNRNDEISYWLDINARANVRVGDIMLITEPRQIEHDITGSLSVVTTERAFIPIEWPTTMISYMPGIPENDTFLGFHVKHKDITLKNINSVLTQCNGSFCDRLFPDVTPCGCYQNNAGRGYSAHHVFKQDIVFDAGIIGAERSTATCSSLRFTELLFTRAVPTNITRNTHVWPRLDAIRHALRELVEFVNQAGGWTICGWFRVGTVNDSSGVQVLSDTYGLHISYIHPSHEDILDDDDFKELQKDPSIFFFS